MSVVPPKTTVSSKGSINPNQTHEIEPRARLVTADDELHRVALDQRAREPDIAFAGDTENPVDFVRLQAVRQVAGDGLGHAVCFLDEKGSGRGVPDHVEMGPAGAKCRTTTGRPWIVAPFRRQGNRAVGADPSRLPADQAR